MVKRSSGLHRRILRGDLDPTDPAQVNDRIVVIKNRAIVQALRGQLDVFEGYRMPLALDHVVIAVDDLHKAIEDYRTLGFNAVFGGEHANGVTHNGLIVFDDGAYLELIAFKRPDPGNRWSQVFESAGEGFVDHALLPDDIDAVVASAQERGLDIASPEDGGRQRPDGAVLKWKTARSLGSDVPFLCGDVTPRVLRVQDGDVRRQPNGVTGIAALTIAVRDISASSMRYAALLGVPAPSPADSFISGQAVLTAAFMLGSGTGITLAAPASPTGVLAAALAARGEGPFALTLHAPRGAKGALDIALSHGAHLSIQSG